MYPIEKMTVEVETKNGNIEVELMELTVGDRLEIVNSPEKNNAMDGLTFAGMDREIMLSMGAKSLDKLWIDYVNHFYPPENTETEKDAKKNL